MRIIIRIQFALAKLSRSDATVPLPRSGRGRDHLQSRWLGEGDISKGFLMRKKPVQQRSQQMVEALVDAAALTIAERGLENTTTSHIAERAGVSVGSLYQYFKDKEALTAALLDRLTQDLNRVVLAGLPALLDADTRTFTRSLLQAALDFFEQRDGLYLELVRHWHRLDIQRALGRFEQNMQEVFRLYAMRHYQHLHFRNLPARAYVLTNSTVFTLLRYLSQQPPPFTREQLLEELTDVIAGAAGVPATSKSAPKKSATKRVTRTRPAQ